MCWPGLSTFQLSFHSRNNPTSKVLWSSSFYKRRNWGTERLSNLPKVTQLATIELALSVQFSEMKCVAIYCHTNWSKMQKKCPNLSWKQSGRASQRKQYLVSDACKSNPQRKNGWRKSVYDTHKFRTCSQPIKCLSIVSP